jgi:hypothetical protein
MILKVSGCTSAFINSGHSNIAKIIIPIGRFRPEAAISIDADTIEFPILSPLSFLPR